MQNAGLSGFGNSAVRYDDATTWPRRLVSVPSSRTVGCSTSPRTANTWLRPSAGQRPVGCPVQHRVQRAEVVRLRPGASPTRRCGASASSCLAARLGGGELELLGDLPLGAGRSAAAPPAAAAGPAAGRARRSAGAVVPPVDAACGDGRRGRHVGLVQGLVQEGDLVRSRGPCAVDGRCRRRPRRGCGWRRP